MVKVRRRHQIFHFNGYAGGSTPDEAFRLAQKLTLHWIRAKTGLEMPGEAWNGSSFKQKSQNNTVEALNVETDDRKFWALRYQHPCADTPGRIWKTDIGLSIPPRNWREHEDACRFDLSLQTLTPKDPEISEPPSSVPMLFKDISKTLNLISDDLLVNAPQFIDLESGDPEAEDKLGFLIDFLQDPERKKPVIVISQPEYSPDILDAAVDAEKLASACAGFAYVYVLTPDAALELSEAFPNGLVYGGAVKMFRPANEAKRLGFHYGHPMIFPSQIEKLGNEEQLEEELHSMVTMPKSPKQYGQIMDIDVVRLFTPEGLAASVKMWQERMEKVRSPDIVKELKEKLTKVEEEAQSAFDLASQEELLRQQTEEIAKITQEEKSGIEKELEQLKQNIASNDQKPKASGKKAGLTSLFPSLQKLPEWVENVLSDKLFLHPRAVRAVQDSDYKNSDLVYLSILALSDEFRQMKLGSNGKMRDQFQQRVRDLGLQDGNSIAVQEAGKFGDTYFVELNGKKVFVDRHLTKGKSRKSEECLRIYYVSELQNQRVCVAHLPSHLDNRFS